jgi:hypothetical protein
MGGRPKGAGGSAVGPSPFSRGPGALTFVELAGRSTAWGRDAIYTTGFGVTDGG